MALEEFFGERLALREYLASSGEISHANTAGSDIAKLFVIASASHFESEITAIVRSLFGSPGDALHDFVSNRALGRAYFSLFDWGGANANGFFALFGPDCKARFVEAKRDDPTLVASEKAFLAIGAERNIIVHGNYAYVSASRTPEEVMNLHNQAQAFVGAISGIIAL